MRDKTGGAAFPTPRFMVDDESRILGFSIHTDGMSLRDYFAAQALPQVMKQWTAADFKGWSEVAYEMADAMLEERSK
jgi:hypothetical protein